MRYNIMYVYIYILSGNPLTMQCVAGRVLVLGWIYIHIRQSPDNIYICIYIYIDIMYVYIYILSGNPLGSADEEALSHACGLARCHRHRLDLRL